MGDYANDLGEFRKLTVIEGFSINDVKIWKILKKYLFAQMFIFHCSSSRTSAS